MNTITEYLKWRGEIPFQQVPYNEVDAYILAKIGVPNFLGIIPAYGAGIPLKEAFERYFSRKDIDPDYLGRLNQPILSKTLRQLPQTGRFGELILSDYLQEYNENTNKQISALTISVPGGPTVITFRGTDDSIVGWKENFLMAVRDTVPAQGEAVNYLEGMARKHPGPLAVIGHSKGGNLAVYAAATAEEEVQKRITRVYNFDGPGFRREFWARPGTQRMQSRIFNYVSQHTLVGVLLTQSKHLTICRSNRSGPMAHEVMFWEVMGPSFIREKSLCPLSAKLDRLLNKQIAQMTGEELSRFIEDFFGVLTSTGASTLTELTRQSPEQLLLLLKEINNTESIKELGKNLIELFFDDIKPDKKQDKRQASGVLKKIQAKRKQA